MVVVAVVLHMVVVVDVAAAAVAAAAADVFRVSPQLLGVGVAVSDTILLICCCRTPHWLFQYRSLILTLVRWSRHDGFASSGQQIPLSSNTSVCRQKLAACSCSVSLVTGHFPYTRNREPQLNPALCMNLCNPQLPHIHDDSTAVFNLPPIVQG